MKLTTIPLLLTLSLSQTACASLVERAFTNAATAKEIATAAFGVFQKRLQARLQVCVDRANSQEEFDGCMGDMDAASYQQLMRYIENYVAAAEVLSTTLADESSTKDEIRHAYKQCIVAATLVLESMPGADAELLRLKKLVKEFI